MAQRTHADHFLLGQIIGHLLCGCMQIEVSEKFEIAHSVISRLWQQLQEEENVSRRFSTGLAGGTTPQDDWYLTIIAKKCQRVQRQTYHDNCPQLQVQRSTRHIVYRRLGQCDWYVRRCVPLAKAQCTYRLSWCRKDITCTFSQLGCELFTDECGFSMQSDSSRVFIWRVQGTRYKQENIPEQTRFDSGGLLAWNGFILGSLTKT